MELNSGRRKAEQESYTRQIKKKKTGYGKASFLQGMMAGSIGGLPHWS